MWPFTKKKKVDGAASITAAVHPIIVNPSVAEREKRAATRIKVVEEQIKRWQEMPKTHDKYKFRAKKLAEFQKEYAELKVKLGVS